MKTIQMPLKYVQGKNVISKIFAISDVYGNKYAIITDNFMKEKLSEDIKNLFSSNKKKTYEIFTFEKDITELEIKTIKDKINESEWDTVVGLGGGKSLDMAKVVSAQLGKPLIVIPTTASTDSATSAISVIYNEDGSLNRYVYLDKNPALVLADTGLIVRAPVRHLIAGMGETLSTYYEAKACYDSKSLNKLGGTPSLSTITISKLALDIVLEKGLLAKVSAEQHIVNEAVDQIIEANIFMSGFGFENSGLAAAHSIHNGLVSLKETAPYLHGEKVAFGTIVQLVLENRNIDDILKVITFCKKIGLPHKLSDLGIVDNIPQNVKLIASRACEEGESMHNMPFEVTKTMVFDAIMVADKLGSYE